MNVVDHNKNKLQCKTFKLKADEALQRKQCDEERDRETPGGHEAKKEQGHLIQKLQQFQTRSARKFNEMSFALREERDNRMSANSLKQEVLTLMARLVKLKKWKDDAQEPNPASPHIEGRPKAHSTPREKALALECLDRSLKRPLL
ncbi:hypothetical protein F0562_007111 [Nyssa sinensis]|uniref:Uncharacterized protein n=1 Tax=Nyssa sinensis TaxID=561372 RepID=A0A5J5A5F2_9ASTE|nr:hypothetical protein F0562_007111 [Nyssa sinensis]